MAKTVSKPKDKVSGNSGRKEKNDTDVQLSSNKRWLAGFLMFVIPCLTILTSELNSRVAAEAFIRDELQIVRREIAQLPKLTTTQTNEGSQAAIAAIISKRSDLELREKLAHQVQKGLSALSVAGSPNRELRVSSMIAGYMDYIIAQAAGSSAEAASRVLENQELAEKIRTSEQELTFIEEYLQVFAEFPPTPNTRDTAQLNLMRFSSELPALDPSKKSRSEQIVENFDIGILTTLRDDGITEETYAKVYADFAAQAREVRNQLAQRAEEIRRDLDASIKDAGTGSIQAIKIEATTNPNEESNNAPLPASDITSPSAIQTAVAQVLSFVPSRNTTTLTVLLGLFSGCLGALFLGLVNENANVIMYLMKGAVAGLVAIFVVKGGNTLLTVNVADAMDTANPFSVAFVGFIVGLFSDRFFEYLRTLVDKATEPRTNDVSADNGDDTVAAGLDEARSELVMQAIPDDAKTDKGAGRK